MTGTASVGLISIFVVDFANLFYISMLGQSELTAAIGYASTLLFFTISISIGVMIAAIALVSKAIGKGERERARELSGSSLIFVLLVTIVMASVAFPFIPSIVELIGAKGEAAEITVKFLQVVIPSMPLMGIGMCASGLLRAVGDAKRAMYVTLGSGIIAAVLDPLFIFTFDLGIQGAAYVMVIARLGTVLIGLYSVIKIHDLITIPSPKVFFSDVNELKDVAVPAVLTNVATPVGNAYVTSSIAPYGDEAVAGWAIIGRLIPVAFGFIFALSGAIGPIIGQNYGAGIYDRVRETVKKSLIVTAVYTGLVWLLVFLLRDIIIEQFNATGEAASLVAFFINLVIATFLFNSMMFVANAAFNNLGFATYSTMLNWAKATIGTVPFVWVGASIAGAHGVIAGWGLGAVAFGILAIVSCLRVVNKLDGDPPKGDLPPPLWRAALSAFSSGKGANIQ